MAYATPDDLAQALRIANTPKVEPVLQDCLDAAAQEIDHFIDRADDNPLPDPPPALIKRVNVNRAVEYYKASDAAFGGVGFADTGVLTVPTDSFARHGAALVPLKDQFGIA
jgi:hypothetical protein